MNILIVKLGAIGDVLRTTFVTRGLKEKYPHCNITWLTKENARPLIDNNSYIDLVVTWEHRDSIVDKLFDIVYSLDEEEETCEFVTKIKKKVLHGAYLSEAREKKYTDSVESWFGMGLLRPEEKGGKKLADELKAKNRRTFQDIYSQIFDIQSLQNKKPVLNLLEEEKLYGNRFAEPYLSKGKTMIGVNSGAGMRWPLKMLSVEKATKICNALAGNLNNVVFLIGGVEEKTRKQSIKALCPSENVIVVEATENIRKFAIIINVMDLIITADSLALHIALALNKKTVSFFGPTSPWEIDMFEIGKKVFAESDCLACYKKEIKDKQSCMDLLLPEQIISAVDELLALNK